MIMYVILYYAYFVTITIDRICCFLDLFLQKLGATNMFMYMKRILLEAAKRLLLITVPFITFLSLSCVCSLSRVYCNLSCENKITSRTQLQHSISLQFHKHNLVCIEQVLRNQVFMKFTFVLKYVRMHVHIFISSLTQSVDEVIAESVQR